MQRFTLHSHHLNKDPALTSWENQLIIYTASEVSTTEALVLFICYNHTGCGVIKMPSMIRLVRKSDKQAVLGLLHRHSTHGLSRTKSGCLLGPSRHFCLGRRSPAFEAPSQALGNIWKDAAQWARQASVGIQVLLYLNCQLLTPCYCLNKLHYPGSQMGEKCH